MNNKKQIKNRYFAVGSMLILFLCLLIFALLWKQSVDGKIRFIVLAKRMPVNRSDTNQGKIEFIRFEMDKGIFSHKSIMMVDFPYKVNKDDLFSFDSMPRLYNKTADTWFLFATNQESIMMQIPIMNRNSIGKISNYLIQYRVIPDPNLVQDVSGNGNSLILSNGFYINSKEGGDREKYTKLINSTSINTMSLGEMHFKPINCLFQADDTIVSQGMGNDDGGYEKNILVCVSDRQKTCEAIISGYSVIQGIDKECSIPFDLSADGNRLVFWSYFGDLSKNQQELWLSVWNMKNRTVKKVLKISKTDSIDGKYGYCKWSPTSKKNRLFLYSAVKNSLTGKHTKGIVSVIDMERCNVISQLKGINPVSIRWTADGNHLVLIDKKIVSSGDTETVLYLFDVQNNSLQKVETDKDYFDIISPL